MKREKIKQLLTEPISFYLVIGIILLATILILDYHWLNFNNKSDVLVEAHGLLFDVILFGILFLIFDKVSERKRDINRSKENIDDIRGWDSDEAPYRFVSNLKRLIALNAKDIDLSYCHLKEGGMLGLNLKSIDFSKAVLDKAIFTYSILDHATLSSCSVNETNFNYCDLSNATFDQFVEGKKAKFKGAKLERINMDNAKLTECDFSYLKLTRGSNRVKEDLREKSYVSELELGQDFIVTNLDGGVLTSGTFDKSNFTKAILQNANLSGANFEEATMIETDFTNANLTGSNFKGANLENAILDSCIFDKRNKRITNFKNARLVNAVINNVEFELCDFKGATFSRSIEHFLKSKIDTTQVKFE